MAEDNDDVQALLSRRTDCVSFLDNVLRPELEAALKQEKQVEEEISEYKELSQRLKTIDMTPMVDLGYEKVFCRAKIESKNFIYVHVGMGFHVELSIPEAEQFIERRIRFLESSALKNKSQHTLNIKKHIDASEVLLDAISTELEALTG